MPQVICVPKPLSILPLDRYLEVVALLPLDGFQFLYAAQSITGYASGLLYNKKT